MNSFIYLRVYFPSNLFKMPLTHRFVWNMLTHSRIKFVFSTNTAYITYNGRHDLQTKTANGKK